MHSRLLEPFPQYRDILITSMESLPDLLQFFVLVLQPVKQIKDHLLGAGLPKVLRGQLPRQTVERLPALPEWCFLAATPRLSVFVQLAVQRFGACVTGGQVNQSSSSVTDSIGCPEGVKRRARVAA